MEFPERVNLVYGRGWVLKRSGNGSVVQSAPQSEVEKDDSRRYKCDYRWLIEPIRGKDGEFLLRNDHHPRHAVRAGIPLTVERRDRGQINHRWRVAFPGPAAASVNSPFHIRSVASGMYLTVAKGTVTLEKDAPAELWQAHDATGAFMKAFQKMVLKVPKPLAPGAAKPRGLTGMLEHGDGGAASFSTTSSGESVRESPSDRPCLGHFAGGLAEAFERLPDLGADFPEFSSYQHILDNQVELCESWELPCPAGCTMSLEDVFRELFARGSSFMGRYQQRRKCVDVNWQPPEPREKEPWCAAARLHAVATVPVVGSRPYEEFQKYMMCKDGTQSVLAVHQVGFVDVGWMVGKVRNEALYMFAQENGNGRIRLRALAPIPPNTSFREKKVEGALEAFEDYRAVATTLLESWEPSLLQGIPIGVPARKDSPETAHATRAEPPSSFAAPGSANSDEALECKVKQAAYGYSMRVGPVSACCGSGLLLLVLPWSRSSGRGNQ